MHPKTKQMLEGIILSARIQGVEIGEIPMFLPTHRYRGISELREFVEVSGDYSIFLLKPVSEIEDILAMEDL